MWWLVAACVDPTNAAGGLVLHDLGPAGLLGRTVEVSGPTGSVQSLTCTADDDPLEHHVLPLSPVVLVLGLLADTRYTCAAGAASTSFHTDPLPDLVDFTVSGSTTGYTLFSTQRGTAWDSDPSWLVIVDPDGEVRWLYEIGDNLVCDLDAQFVGGQIHVGGGWAFFSASQPNKGVFTDVDLEGHVLLSRDAPAFGLAFNHHSERLQDGSTLSLTGSHNTLADRTWLGVGVEWWHPDEGLRWTWDTQQLVDDGVLAEPREDLNNPWLANAVALVDDVEGPAMWMSNYAQRELWRIDRNTGALTAVLGVGSDFALVDSEGVSLPDSEWPHSQHNPQWTDGPTGPGGRVLLYDNGNGIGRSRVVEYDVDLGTKTVTQLWSWTEPDWFNPTLGDADRLPDGHVLITQGFNRARTPESTDHSELVELDPPNDVVWRLSFNDPQWPVYRAQRIDGCELFANTRFCDR